MNLKKNIFQINLMFATILGNNVYEACKLWLRLSLEIPLECQSSAAVHLRPLRSHRQLSGCSIAGPIKKGRVNFNLV
jgi:hypothetical protein